MKGLNGLLKCYTHDESFDTPEEFYKHQADKPHGFTGTTKCVDCGCKNVECHADEEICSERAHARCPKCEAIEEKAVLARIAKRKESSD